MTRTQRTAAVLALAMALAAPASAGPSTPPGAPCQAASRLPRDADDESRRVACEIPPAYQQDVLIAQVIGRAIRAHDIAAWLTTDALRDAGAFEPMPPEGRGWLTRQDGDRIRVRYLSRVDGQDRAFAEAALRFEPWGVVDVARLATPAALDAREQRLMRARDTVDRMAPPSFCTPSPPNTVAFEFEEDGVSRILVFLLSAWTNDAAPLGGFHMYRVSEDGTRVEDHFAQTRRCLTMPSAQLEAIEALNVSHDTSAAPTMFHVFLALQYRKPLLVLTTQNDLLWKIDGPRIELLREEDPLHRAARDWADKVPRSPRPVPTSSPIG